MRKEELTGFRADLTGGDALLWRAFESFFVESAVAQTYNEAKGEPGYAGAAKVM